MTRCIRRRPETDLKRAAAYDGPVERPREFEHNRFVGDKRTQVVYDLEQLDDDEHGEMIAELMEAATYQSFGPDTLAEARNRGYRLSSACDRRVASEA